MKKILLLACLLASFLSHAQIISGDTGPIPDTNTLTAYTAQVTGLPSAGGVLNGQFGLESVMVSITHPYVSNLQLQLQAPDGTVINLSLNNGGSRANYTSTIFTGTAGMSIANGTAPFSGLFRPQGTLGTVNNGQGGNGTWRLLVRDTQAGNAGSVGYWQLTFSNTPAAPSAFTSSNLPIVVINTNGRTIPDEPKIDAYMGIINNGPGQRNRLSDRFNDYHNKIGIEVRGSSSQLFPQKSFSIETRDLANVEHDTLVLGMPAENAWVLYAPYDDKTCLRNVLSYDIANKTGHYAARTRYCELVLNGQYQGIYVMLEKVKRDANRVNIKKLETTDVSGNKLTGGYIFKIDKPTGNGGNDGWNSKYASSTNKTIRFLFDYPSATDIVYQQAVYLRAYVDSMETALASPDFASPTTGYAKYIDVNSFVDYFLLNEASKNVDGLRISTYLHKKRRSDGGKLYAGPAWDYNLAWWNANYCAGSSETGWAYNYNSVCPTDDIQVPFWWARLMQDPAFTAALKCRWTALRQRTLHLDTLNAFIDANATRLAEAKSRHFAAWPILGVYTWPNPTPIPADYAAEIAALKQWLKLRFAWLDANMPGTCSQPLATLPGAGTPAGRGQVYPNPFDKELRYSLTLADRAPVQVALYDLTGRQVAQAQYGTLAAGPHELPLQPGPTLAAGVYMLKVTAGDAVYNTRVEKL